jgi:hypothetical protein
LLWHGKRIFHHRPAPVELLQYPARRWHLLTHENQAVAKYNPQIHHRRSIRLKGYDYARPGAYFVTICTQNRECVLGEIVDGEMHYSSMGLIVHDFWTEVAVHFPHVDVPSFIIMPNHVHAMIIIRDAQSPDDLRSGPRSPRRGGVTTPVSTISGRGLPAPTGVDPAPTRGDATPTGGKPDLGRIVAFYKYQTTRRINAQNKNPGVRFWQRNYYEHIVRNDHEYR